MSGVPIASRAAWFWWLTWPTGRGLLALNGVRCRSGWQCSCKHRSHGPARSQIQAIVESSSYLPRSGRQCLHRPRIRGVAAFPCPASTRPASLSLASIFRVPDVLARAVRLVLIFRCRPWLAARLSRRVGGVPRALVFSFPGRGSGCGWSPGREGLQPGDCRGDLAGLGLALVRVSVAGGGRRGRGTRRRRTGDAGADSAPIGLRCR
jgi:hypothetical protein